MLSVILFIIAINEITSTITPPITAFLYVDDLTVIYKGKNPITTLHILQDCINKLQNWANNNGFKFSKTKTEVITFSRTQNESNIKLTLDGSEIKQTTTIKLLGMIFDNKLSWNPHIEYLKSVCTRRLNVLKALAANNWEADAHILLNTYKR